jgi:TolA-binding protein
MKSAVLTIALVALAFASCSRRSPETVFTEASQAESQKNYPHAAEVYESVVADYPASALAESSLVRLSNIYHTELKDARKTLNAYQRCYTMFPASKDAPTMLFLTGWVYNNDLQQLDSARAVYETFLIKYPKHELAASAEFELKTLGRDPGDLLGSTQTQSKNPQVSSTKPK